MARLHEVKRERAASRAKLAEARAAVRTKKAALRTKAEELPAGEDLPEADISELDGLQATVTALEATCDALDTRVARLEQLQDDDADAAREPDQVDEPGDTVAASFGSTVQRGLGHNRGPRLTGHGHGETAHRNEKGFAVARWLIGKAMLRRGQASADVATFIERRFGDKAVAKALNTTGVATGGALIPQDFVPEIIELLRADEVIRSLEPEFMDMPRGNLTIPREAGQATASYGGELDAIVPSQPTYDALQLNAKKLTALVPVTNDLIRRVPANVEAQVRNSLIQALKLREDLAFIMADGSLGTPIGLINQCSSANKLIIPAFSATDNATILTAVVGAAGALNLVLRNNMSKMIRPAWIMSAVTESFLRTLRDGVGNFVYRDEMNGGKFEGRPYRITQQLPTNINTAASGAAVNNGAYLILVDMADVIVADTLEYQVEVFDQATYVTGGTTVSAVQMDQTVFRVISEHDLALRHQASLAIAMVPGWAPAGFSNYSGGTSYYSQSLTGDMSAAPSTWGTAAPSGSNNPGNIAANVAGGQLPGRP